MSRVGGQGICNSRKVPSCDEDFSNEKVGYLYGVRGWQEWEHTHRIPLLSGSELF